MDIQKANMWKRISALVLDLVMICVLAAGGMLLIAALTDYDGYADKVDWCYVDYAQRFDLVDTDYTEDAYYALADTDSEAFTKLNDAVDKAFKLTESDYNALSEAQKENFKNAQKALFEDETFLRSNTMAINLTMVMTTFGIFIAYILWELVLPLIFGNGQTLGKKIFGICLMRVDGVKITTLMLFVRTLLGKYTVEVMIPVMIVFMLIFGSIGIVGLAVLVLLLLLQIGLILTTRNRTAIHDAFAQTVVVDYLSQKIFASEEEKLEYQKRLAAEKAETQSY